MSPLIPVLLGAARLCGTNAPDSRFEIGLYADFQNETSAAVVQTIQDELAAIMIPIGPTVKWRSLAENRGDERWTTLVVVHFRGKCDLSDLATYPPYPWILGRTHLSDGEIIPFSEIYCSSIRAFLAPSLASMNPPARGLAYGRAVARVLAHEIYHVLARTKRHGSGGIGEAAYTPEELAADHFSFQEKEVQRLRVSLEAAFGPVASRREALCRTNTPQNSSKAPGWGYSLSAK